MLKDPTALMVCGSQDGKPLCRKIADSISMYSWKDTSLELPCAESLAEKLLDTFKSSMGDQDELHWERVAPILQTAWRRVAVCAIQQLLHLGSQENLPFSAALPACKLGAEIRCAEWPEGIVLVYKEDAASTGPELLFKMDPIAQEKLQHTIPENVQRTLFLFELLAKSIPENNWEIADKWELPEEICSFIDMGAVHNTMTSGTAPMCL